MPAALRTGSERTAVQDIGYGLRQLTHVVVRALSPGINDRTTAVHGLISCTAVLGDLLDRRLGPYPLCDEHDRVRVVLERPTFTELLDLVCTQPRHYGAGDPVVLDALVSMLRELAWKATTAEQRTAITDQLTRLQKRFTDQDTATRRHLDHLARQARRHSNDGGTRREGHRQRDDAPQQTRAHARRPGPALTMASTCSSVTAPGSRPSGT